METIKNYLETMFANMPNTDSVKKAKSELLAMMEDKYTELINEGRSANEAVGTVIAEFGNLDDLAEELGVASEVQEERRNATEMPRRHVSFEEITGFVSRQTKSAILIATGVFLCIISVIFPIIGEGYLASDVIGVLLMFLSIFLAVGIFVYNANFGREYDFMKNERCQIDKSTVDFFADERRRHSATFALMKAIGVMFCAGCWLPAIVIDEYLGFGDELVGVALFLMVGIGVFFIIYSANMNKLYRTILTINDENTISGTYGKDEEVVYKNETVASIMSIYWPTITCIYLIWSFITFDWHISWIIWPLAAIVRAIINTVYEEN